MSNDIATQQGGNLTAPEFFAREVQREAVAQVAKMMEGPEGKKAANAITMAFVSAIASAKKPQAYADAATNRPDSIAACISLSMRTKLYPGGPNPDVYLVPQSGELQWRVTHRGIAKTLAREGFHVMAVPVGNADTVRVSMGEVVEHVQHLTDSPQSLNELLGVCVVVRRMGDSAVLARLWTSVSVIDARRKSSRMSNYGPWVDWPIEMAQKTAILYHAARGHIPAESQAMDDITTADHGDTVLTAIPAPAQAPALQIQEAAKPANLHAFLDQEGATMCQLDAWGVSQGHKPASEMDAKAQSETAVWLAKNPEVVAAVKAIGGAE